MVARFVWSVEEADSVTLPGGTVTSFPRLQCSGS